MLRSTEHATKPSQHLGDWPLGFPEEKATASHRHGFKGNDKTLVHWQYNEKLWDAFWIWVLDTARGEEL